ncbi:MAG: hypothetical protein ACPGC5_05100 [Flavobacteriaceae bacterium]
MKTRILFFYLLIIGSFTWAQENTTDSETIAPEEVADSIPAKVKRLSLGVKLGVPNVAGGSAEVVLPFLNNRIAPYADFSGFDVEDADTEIGLSYNEFGLNVYFGDKGKGFYAGIGAGSLSTDLTFYDTFEEQGVTVEGKGSIGVDIKSTNLKIGVKTGGRIYFRFELGYGFTGDVPSEVTVRLEEIGGSGTDTEVFEFPSVPGVGDGGLLVGNIGFGISF